MDVRGLIKHGSRVFRRSPGFAIVVIVTLGLGIGANSAVFSLVSGVLLRPLPYENGPRLVRMLAGPVQAGGQPGNLSPPELTDLRERASTVDRVLEYHTMFFNLIEAGQEPERVQVGVVSWDFFQSLGVPPAYGRTFSADEDHLDADPVLVLGHDYWLTRFGGDPDVVGRTVEMNNRPHRIVGVLPQVPTYPNQNQVWMPWYACPFRAADSWHLNRQARSLLTVGRLAPGSSVEAAEAEIGRITQDLRAEYGDAYPGVERVDAALVPLKEELTVGARGAFATLLAMSVLVLLIACANVANLSLARLNRRQHEITVQSALGASRSRIVQELLSESVLLALAGAVLAVGMAYGSVGLLAGWVETLSPRFNEIEVDGWVLLFTGVVAVVTGIVVGAVPGLLTRPSAEGLRSAKSTGSRAAGHLRAGLVAAQIAMAFTLLAGSGLMVRSFVELTRVQPGFDAENVLTLTIDLDWAAYPSREEAVPFYRALMDRVEGRPQVVAASVASDFPMSGATFQTRRGLLVEGEAADGQPPQVNARFVGPGYFDVLRIPTEVGRLLSRGDDAGSEPVAVLSRSASERFFPDADPLNRRISTDGGQTWATVVGVVGDVRQEGFEAGLNEEVYFPFEQAGFARRLLVRTAGDPTELARAITEDVYAVDPNQPVSFVQTLDDALTQRVASPRTIATLLTLFALVALITATFGIMSVVAFATSQRRREIGIRLALGGKRRDVILRILGRGLATIGLGLAAGLALTLLAGNFLAGFLFGLEPTDPVTLGGVALLLLMVATVATLLPALKGTSVDPVEAFRADG